MKHVFSSPDAAQTALVRSLLDAAGIPCEIRNDAVSRAEVGMPFITELWVLGDEDYEEARSLIRAEGSASIKPE